MSLTTTRFESASHHFHFAQLTAALLFFVAALLSSGAAFSAEPVPDADIADGRIHRGILDGKPVRFTVVNGNAISEGDILLGPARTVLERVRAEALEAAFPGLNAAIKSQKGLAVGGTNRLWPRNAQGIVEVPYVITTDPQNRVPAAIEVSNNQIGAFLRWIPRTTQSDYVAFNLSEDENFGSCFSNIGRSGGVQNIGGSRSCGVGTLVHEMGHAIGLYHEQHRSDRSTWLTLDRDNVDPQYVGNFDEAPNQRDLGGFDYGSIMHYSPYAFLKSFKPSLSTIPAGIPIGARDRYSAGDIEAIRRLYGFVEQTTTIDTFPSNQQVLVNGVLTNTPAVFNWPIGSKHTLDVPAGVKNVNGNLLTFGRWSNDRAATLNPRQSITITAGDGTYGQPTNAPAVSTYTAHFSTVVEVRSGSNIAGGGANLSPPPQPIAGAPGLYYRRDAPMSAVASPPAGFQFALWGPPSGLFHFPTASNRSSNPFSGPVSIGADYVLADWIANFTPAALARVKAVHAGGEFTGGIVTRVDGTNNTDQNLPATSYLWADGETREFQAKAIFRGLTSNVRYKFVAWEGGPTSTAADRIIVTKPTGPMSGNTEYTARYVKQFKALTELDNASGSCGSVTLDRAGPDEGFYNFGDTLTARYTPPAGMQITRWNGNFTGSGNQATIVINDIPYAAPEINTVAEPLRITSLSKNQFTFNAPIEFDITGTGFTATSEVFVANVRRTATLVAPNQLRVTIPASETPDVGKGTLYVANRVGACGALAFSSVDIKASATGSIPNTGWWWNRAESGRGFFMERRGNTLFMAGYLYEADGRPTWFISSGPINGNVFTGRATTSRNGQTLEGNYVAPQVAADLGPITLTFTDASNATMAWPGGNTPLTSFVFGGNGPGSGTSLGESGWWWNETESGRGYSIEVQGGTLFMVAFMYDASGNPVWYLSSGAMQSATRYAGRLLTVRGGQTLTGPYQAPAGNTDIGSISFDFTTADRAIMTLPSGKVVALTRFRF